MSICTTYSASRAPPIATTVAVVAACFEDVHRLGQGRWRFAERHVRPIFTAQG